MKPEREAGAIKMGCCKYLGAYYEHSEKPCKHLGCKATLLILGSAKVTLALKVTFPGGQILG